MRVPFLGLAAAAALAACAGEPTTPSPGKAPLPVAAARADVPGEQRSVYIRYRADAPPARAAMLRDRGATFVTDLASRRLLATTMPAAAAHGLDALPWVEHVRVSDLPPMETSGDLVSWGVDSIGARHVHADLGNRGASVRVAVLDSRISCDHGDLKDRISAGIDVVDSTKAICGPWNPLAYPVHGTQVAGIIAASANGTGLLGVAPEVRIVPVRVCRDDGACEQPAVAGGLHWALENDIDIVNLSLGTHCGGPADTEVLEGLAALEAAGIVVVAAAGNGVDKGCPPGSPVSGMAAVASTVMVSHWRPDGTQNPGYQYGPEVDIAAPTRVPTANPNSGVQTAAHDGTSYSVPHVSGALALLIREGFSGAALLRRRLEETAVDRGATGKDDHWGWGTLDVRRAVVRRPVISGIASPPLPISAAGSATLTAAVAHGAPPLAVTWRVTYSSAAIAPSYAVSGGTSHTVAVPSGSYSITVTATPRETSYGRTGPGYTVTLPVCTGSVEPLASGPGGRGGIGAQRKAGC